MRGILAAILTVVCGAAALAGDAPHLIAGVDLSIETHKWDGKAVRVIAQCFYADVDEYRCVVADAGGAARVDFSTITPPEMKKAVEDGCDTAARSMGRACRFQIDFTYEEFHWMDGASGSKMAVITPAFGVGAFLRAK